MGAEKKIELQDIEEDNLKSEKEVEQEKTDTQDSGLLPLEFLKNGLLRYFESPTHTQQPQQPRYVQQYAVTEAPERSIPVPVQPQPTAQPKTQYGPPTTQQAMVGYLSNVPMQIYLVPQYYDQSQQVQQAAVQYTAPGVPRVAYPSAPEAVQTQTNYVEIPTYVAPTAKTYVQSTFSPPVAYLSYTSQPTAPTHTTATVTPVVAYQMPVQVQYPTAVGGSTSTKAFYQNVQYPDTNNAIDDEQEIEDDGQKYSTQTEAPYPKSPSGYYSSRHPVRDDYRYSSVSELPPPNPLLLKAPPSHLSHIPKALPVYRPLNKPVYSGSGFIPNYTHRPHEVPGLGSPFKRRPASLLDSYIPSSVQFEYLKRGYSKDPLVLYESLANSGRHFHHGHPPVIPRHYERGFLPNQMYHTASGGVTFGHYKRSPPKLDKSN